MQVGDLQFVMLSRNRRGEPLERSCGMADWSRGVTVCAGSDPQPLSVGAVPKRTLFNVAVPALLHGCFPERLEGEVNFRC